MIQIFSVFTVKLFLVYTVKATDSDNQKSSVKYLMSNFEIQNSKSVKITLPEYYLNSMVSCCNYYKDHNSIQNQEPHRKLEQLSRPLYTRRLYHFTNKEHF